MPQNNTLACKATRNIPCFLCFSKSVLELLQQCRNCLVLAFSRARTYSDHFILCRHYSQNQYSMFKAAGPVRYNTQVTFSNSVTFSHARAVMIPPNIMDNRQKLVISGLRTNLPHLIPMENKLLGSQAIVSKARDGRAFEARFHVVLVDPHLYAENMVQHPNSTYTGAAT